MCFSIYENSLRFYVENLIKFKTTLYIGILSFFQIFNVLDIC